LLADTSDGHRQWLRDSSDKYVQGTRVMLELGELVSATVYARAQKVRTLVRNSLRTAFETNMLDAIVAPTLPISTIPLEDLSRDLAGSGEIFSALLHHCFVANVVGIPALSVPCGFTSMKLPVGLHLFGRPFDEGQLLRIGHAYQTSTDWHDQHAELEL
jgi:aspartyl-tRNA(Asn)/glutamyl-tRNA(Gln) amidotransferase subunit A